MSDPQFQRLAEETASQGRPPTQLTEAYRRWLAQPGNCPTDNSESRIDNSTALFKQYTDLVPSLLSVVSETVKSSPKLQDTILSAAKRLKNIAEESNIVVSILDGLDWQTSDADAVIAAQNAAIQNMQGAISETIDIMSSGVFNEHQIKLEAEKVRKILGDSWEIFNDPFYYIYLLGENLAVKPVNIEFSVGVLDQSQGVFDNVSLLKPKDPELAREAINNVLAVLSKYGTKTDPVLLKFSWDSLAQALQIDIDNALTVFRGEEPGEKTEGPAPLWSYRQTSMFGSTITIPVPLLEAHESSTSENNFIDIGFSGEPIAALLDSAPPPWSQVFKSDEPYIDIPSTTKKMTDADFYKGVESVYEEYDLTGDPTDYDGAEFYFATVPFPVGSSAAFFVKALPILP